MIPLSDSINININVTINDADNLIESGAFYRDGLILVEIFGLIRYFKYDKLGCL